MDIDRDGLCTRPLSACEPSRSLGLGFRHPAACPEPLALLGGHALPAAAVRASAAVQAEAAEEDAAQGQEAEGLPERDRLQAEECGTQPVPELADDLPAEEGEEDDPRDRERGHGQEAFSSIHVVIPSDESRLRRWSTA